MKRGSLISRSFVNAAATFIYVAAVAWFGFNSQTIFGKQSTFLAPLFALLLFVVSASVTGLLVLGKPIHLYVSGLKKEAVILFSITLGWLILFLLIVSVALLLGR